MILIYDYGVGNLTSIANMLKKAGAKSKISNEEEDVLSADKIILPGVGSFEYGINKLRELSSFAILEREVIQHKKPILGVCLGAQLLFNSSEEGNNPKGLGWIDGEIKKFDETHFKNGEKVPHMGWNWVRQKKESKLLEGLDDARFYFVHSYHMKPFNSEDILLRTEYGYPFISAVEKENVIGVQFHPEKSHKFGLKLYQNFVKNY
ncbi:Imidazole glycerol phosphate synthase subunit HisH 1 [compost metagenome]